MPRPIVQEITAVDKTQRAFRSVERRLSGIKTAFAGLATAITVGGFGVAARNALDFADAIDKASARTGFATDSLQELRFAASQTGVGITELEGGLARFTKRLGLARRGTGAAAKAYQELGIDLSQANEQVFKEVVKTLGDIDNETDGLALTTRLFGDDAQRLFNTFKEGNAGLDQFAQKAKELGLIISEDLIDGAVEANDQLDVLSKVVGIQLTQAFLQLAPIIQNAAEAFTSYATLVADGLRSISEGVNRYRINAEIEERTELLRKIAEKQRILNKLEEERNKNFGFGGSSEFALVAKRNELEVLRERLRVLNETPKELTIDIDVPEAPTVDLPGLPDAPEVDKRTSSLRKLKETYEEMTGPASVYYDLEQRAARIYEQTRTPIEKYNEQLTELTQLYRNGLIDAETFNRAAQQFGDSLPPLVEELNADLEQGVDIAKDFGAVFSSAFEDAITQGDSLRDIIKGLGADITRLITRQLVTNPLAGFFTGLFGSGGGFDLSSFFRASGGPVMAGVPYVVGEAGPEIVVPKSSGTVIPNGQLGGVVNVYVNAPAGASPEAYRQSARQGALEGSRLLQRGSGIR